MRVDSLIWLRGDLSAHRAATHVALASSTALGSTVIHVTEFETQVTRE